MREFRAATLRLTTLYSAIFLGAMALFSGGLYLWTDHSLGEGYVEQVSGKLEQNDKSETLDQRTRAAQIAADVALDRFRNIIIVVNGLAAIIIPIGAYQLTKRSLKPLAESQERQKQFVSNASHELRTPLAVLNGELELALRHTQEGESYKQTLHNSKFQVEQMTQLVHQLLLLTRLNETNKYLNDAKAVDVRETISTVLEQYRGKYTAKKITLTYHPAAMPLNLTGSPTLLDVAIGNMVDNAIKYSSVKGTVTVAADLIGDQIVISVKDHGIGMTESQQKHAFDRFYQADVSRHKEGAGLGLAITKRIADLHRGSIEIRSAINKGSTFVLRLPIGQS